MSNLLHEFLESTLRTVLGFILSSQKDDLLIPAAILSTVMYFFLVRKFCYQPMLRSIPQTNTKEREEVLEFWLLLSMFGALCNFAGLEVWPSVLLTILYVRSLHGGSIGVFTKLPGLRQLEEHREMIRLAFVSQYDLRRSAEDDSKGLMAFFRKSVAQMRLSSRLEELSDAIVLSIAAPGLALALMNATVLQPIATLLGGRSISDFPLDFISSLGTGILMYWVFFYHTVYVSAQLDWNREVLEHAPNQQEMTAAERKLEEVLESMYGPKAFGERNKLLLLKVWYSILVGAGLSVAAWRLGPQIDRMEKFLTGFLPF